MKLTPLIPTRDPSSSRWRDRLCIAAIALLVAIAGGAPAGVAAAPTPAWEVMDLGTLGGDASVGRGINARGEVTGYAYRADGASRAFVWSPATRTMRDLGTLGGRDSEGQGINDLGQVVGTSSTAEGRSRAFMWDPATSTMIDLGTLGGTYSVGLAINNRGQVTGYSQTSAAVERGFIWDPATRTMADIGTLGIYLGRSFSRGHAINDSGQITGVSLTARGSERAFVWDPATGTMTDLLTLNLSAEGYSRGHGINARGQVTGISVAGVGRYSAFIWDSPGPMRALAPLGGSTSSGAAINNTSLVAGSGSLADGSGRTVLWDVAAETITDLTALDGGSNFSAAALNDNGDLGGTGYTVDGFARAMAWLRMTPERRLLGIIERFEAGVADGTIRSAQASAPPGAGTANAFRNLLGRALRALRAGRLDQTCKTLGDAVRRADGVFAPPVTPRDWIGGPNVALLLDDLSALHATLDCR